MKAFQSQFSSPGQDALQQVPPGDSDNCEAGWEEEWREMAYEEDDGLGYYPDGVKRTLTDEQIEIFRHSELHTLRRQKEKEEERKAVREHTLPSEGDPDSRQDSAADAACVDEGEEGEVQGDEQGQVLASVGSKKKRKRKGKNGNGNGRHKEPKPDLRKRTWDVVETGLDSLDYD